MFLTGRPHFVKTAAPTLASGKEMTLDGVFFEGSPTRLRGQFIVIVALRPPGHFHLPINSYVFIGVTMAGPSPNIVIFTKDKDPITCDVVPALTMPGSTPPRACALLRVCSIVLS